MAETILLRLIDKKVNPPTGTIKGGLIDGDLKPYKASVEFDHSTLAKFSTCIVKLVIPIDGKFVRADPNLMDENAKNEFLLEYQITQGANAGKLFRGEIGEPTIIEDRNMGEIISIPCEAIERSTRELPVSPKDDLTTIKDRFISVIDDYEEGRESGTIIGFKDGNADTAIALPDQAKQDWIPFGPTPAQKLLIETMNRAEEAPAVGGVLLDHYYDYNPSTLTTRKTDVFAEEFGKVSSGVVIDPTTFGPIGEGAESQKRVNTDNIVFKNVVIAKGDPRGGLNPPELMRFRSEYLHAIAREVWDSGRQYVVGDLAKRQFPNGTPDERYFKCIVDVVLPPPLPENDPTHWEEDFTVDPTDNPLFFSPNPWYARVPQSTVVTTPLVNLVGHGNAIFDGFRDGEGFTNDGAPYRGFFFDWNIERTLYDRSLTQDFWQRISVKAVNKRANAPPLKSELYDGYRVVLGTFEIDDPSFSPGFEGVNKTINAEGDPSVTPKNNTNPAYNAFHPNNRGRLLEYNGDPFGIQGGGDHPKDTNDNGWILTDPPIDQGTGDDREQDTCNNLETAKVLKWDDSAFGGDGDWVDAWDIATDNDKSSPFHIVKSITMVPGVTGIANQAFEARFDYKRFGLRVPFEKSNGDDRNRNSRGIWISFIHPYPFLPIGGINRGDICGKNPKFPYFDTFNLNRTCDGSIGWNQGLKSEELGRVNGMHIKLNATWFTSEDDSEKALGHANTAMVYWVMDKFGHVYFQDFVHKVNGGADEYTFTSGPRAPQNYFFSRFDELAELLGYKLPFNFFLREREYTGIRFDWRFVKFWGIFSKNTYSEDAGYYIGGFEQYLRQLWEILEQGLHKTGLFFAKIFGQATDVPLTDKVVVDHAKVSIDEFAWVKEAYATSDAIPNPDPRVEVIRAESERDYLTLRAKAIARKARKEFFPQFWHMTAREDVRMKVGQKFTATGSRVPGGTQELVCASAKHIDNADGNSMEVFGVRKFVKT